MTLLVSIHDVTPAFEDECLYLWELCRVRDIVPALLVIPDWHGVAPLKAAPEFVGWVRDRAADGAEIFLHGERHDEVGSPRSLSDEIRAWGKTNREGEFLTLDRAAARARMERGLALFAQLGLSAIGFVPPAWLAKDEGFAAVADVGLAISEDDTSIRLVRAARRLASPVVRWSARTAIRAHGSAFVASMRWRMQRHAPLVRIALHPGDLAHPAALASIEESLDLWSSAHAAGTYASLLAA